MEGALEQHIPLLTILLIMRITCAWGDTVTLLLQGNNAFLNTDTQIMTQLRRLHFVEVFKSLLYQYLRQDHYLSIKSLWKMDELKL